MLVDSDKLNMIELAPFEIVFIMLREMPTHSTKSIDKPKTLDDASDEAGN